MKTIKNISLFCGIVFSIFFVSFMALAWSAPSSAPTGGNVAIPINEGSIAQIKTGPLEVQGLFIAQSNVGIGTTSPRAKLTIADGGSPMGARFLDIGDDTYLTNIDLANTLGIYGIQDNTRSRLKLGSTGGIISGYNNNIGINKALPAYRLDVNGTGRFTGAVIVGNPTLDSHAATKEYVDNNSGGLPTGGTNGSILVMTNDGPMWDNNLTWQGSTHTIYECAKIGGTVFDTGTTGTICRYPSGTVPSGWEQADNWARYYPTTWGGDYCGRYVDGPGTGEFSNNKVTHHFPNGNYGGCRPNCASVPDGRWALHWSGGCIKDEDVGTTYLDHVTTNRVEVGIY